MGGKVKRARQREMEFYEEAIKRQAEMKQNADGEATGSQRGAKRAAEDSPADEGRGDPVPQGERGDMVVEGERKGITSDVEMDYVDYQQYKEDGGV